MPNTCKPEIAGRERRNRYNQARTPDMSKLFTPFTLPSGVTIPNRICKAAMEEDMADSGQVPGEELARLDQYPELREKMSVEGNLEIRPVQSSDWPHFEELFEAPGGPKNCWCMLWRCSPSKLKAMDKASKKLGMQLEFSGGEPLGLLAFMDKQTVGWCAVAPRHSYRKLCDPQPGDAELSIWSLTCMFVLTGHRKSGISVALINAAAAYAKAQHADILEAYPVAPDSPSYRFMGFLPQFERLGFEGTGKEGARRHIVRKRLVV